jgi:hypothetical protein
MNAPDQAALRFCAKRPAMLADHQGRQAMFLAASYPEAIAATAIHASRHSPS